MSARTLTRLDLLFLLLHHTRHTTHTYGGVAGVSRSLVGAIVGFALLAAWIAIFQLRWKTWGSKILPFMITTPEQYSTGW